MAYRFRRRQQQHLQFVILHVVVCITLNTKQMEGVGEGVSDADIATAVRVIEYMNENQDVYKSSSCRSLRMALQPLINLQKDSMFAGTDAHTQGENKRKNTRRKQEMHRLRVEDEKLIQKTVLRAGRMKRLQEIADENGSDLPAVLDGVADDGFNSTVLSESDKPGELIENSKLEQDETSSSKPPLKLSNFRACYICKRRFQELHHFYDSLCPSCADLNWTKRIQTCDMTGRICLVTGGRVKIGFQCCLKLLRCGATVIATSRFPVDTAKRFSMQTDFVDWQDRIHVYGLDLRDLAYVEAFCEMTLRSYSHIDVIINNACQTIRRPNAYYSHMMSEEQDESARRQGRVRGLLERDSSYLASYAKLRVCSASSEGEGHTPSNKLLHTVEELVECADNTRVYPTPSLSSAASVSPAPAPAPLAASGGSAPLTSAELSQVPLTAEDSLSATLSASLFPAQARDVNQQQLDLRRENSWLLRMHQVSSPEVAEVFAINSISPFILVARLKPLLVCGKRQASAEQDSACEEGSSCAGTAAAGDKRGDTAAHLASDSSTPLLSLAESILLQEGKQSTGNKDEGRKTNSGGSSSFDTAHGARAAHVPIIDCSFVVNVSSMEGKFYRRKMASHPHTNMAKAALNMMTRTVAGDYRQDNIFMTAVDTG
jgi:NAD(P)-dependent dehydrogenase (short-subunit alcohol dehydrogenase family)